MATLDEVLNRFFKGRRYLCAMCSTAIGKEPFLISMEKGPQDGIRGLPREMANRILAGMYPLTTVIYDSPFLDDVPAVRSFETMDTRERRGETLEYGFRTTFLDAETNAQALFDLVSQLGQDGRDKLINPDGTLWQFDCKKGERFTNVYIALDPMPGERNPS